MGIATGYLFPQSDDPGYKMGFWTLFAATLFTGVGSAVMTVLTIKENKRREREYGRAPEGVVIDYDEDGLMGGHPCWRYYR